MLADYSQIRMEAKRMALEALSDRADKGSDGPTHVTKSEADRPQSSQVAEKIGGADGIRTHDLLDAIEARSQLRHGPTARKNFNRCVNL